MSAVSNSVMPRSIALWITLREASRSMRWPKLLQPRPTADTRRPELPRLRISMERSCEKSRLPVWPVRRRAARRPAEWTYSQLIRQGALRIAFIAREAGGKKMRPRSDAATDGDRWGRMIRDGGPDQAPINPSLALLRRGDSLIFPQMWRRPRAVTAGPRPARKCSQRLSVDDESGALGDPVVEFL